MSGTWLRIRDYQPQKVKKHWFSPSTSTGPGFGYWRPSTDEGDGVSLSTVAVASRWYTMLCMDSGFLKWGASPLLDRRAKPALKGTTGKKFLGWDFFLVSPYPRVFLQEVETWPCIEWLWRIPSYLTILILLCPLPHPHPATSCSILLK